LIGGNPTDVAISVLDTYLTLFIGFVFGGRKYLNITIHDATKRTTIK
jgi:hypothetical protein